MKWNVIRVGIAGLVGVGSIALGSSADVEVAGRVRVFKGPNTYSIQIDVKNDSNNRAAFGPDVYVRLKDRHGNLITEQFNRKMYQYYGGTATTPNTLNPKQLGYIPITVSTASVNLVHGQEIRVKINGDGQSNFGSDSRDATVCKKGTAGCL